MSLGDFQACPWCAFVGTPYMFDIHIDKEHNEGELRRTHDQDILEEIFEERLRQDEKWGEQNHADGTGEQWTRYLEPFIWREDRAAHIAYLAKAHCERKARGEQLTFLDIALEEIAEAFAETDEALLRAELVQSAAVLINWIGAIDRRKRNETEDK